MLAVSRSSITAAKRVHLTIEWDQKVVLSSHTFPVHLAAILPLRRAVFDRYGWPLVAGMVLGTLTSCVLFTLRRSDILKLCLSAVGVDSGNNLRLPDLTHEKHDLSLEGGR